MKWCPWRGLVAEEREYQVLIFTIAWNKETWVFGTLFSNHIGPKRLRQNANTSKILIPYFGGLDAMFLLPLVVESTSKSSKIDWTVAYRDCGSNISYQIGQTGTIQQPEEKFATSNPPYHLSDSNSFSRILTPQDSNRKKRLTRKW